MIHLALKLKELLLFPSSQIQSAAKSFFFPHQCQHPFSLICIQPVGPEVVSLKEEDGPPLRLEDGGKETCF